MRSLRRRDTDIGALQVRPPVGPDAFQGDTDNLLATSEPASRRVPALRALAVRALADGSLRREKVVDRTEEVVAQPRRDEVKDPLGGEWD